MMKRGFTRAKVDGEVYEIENIPDLEKNKKHDIEIVVDRIIMTKDLGNRLADSLETTLSLTDGIAIIENISDNSRSIFSSKFACPVSGFSISEIEPRLFSFNNPFGACSACDGLGFRMYFNPELIVPNHSLSIQDGAIISWSKTSSPYFGRVSDLLLSQSQGKPMPLFSPGFAPGPALPWLWLSLTSFC